MPECRDAIVLVACDCQLFDTNGGEVARKAVNLIVSVFAEDRENVQGHLLAGGQLALLMNAGHVSSAL